MPTIRVGVQAPTGSAGQVIDFDGGDVATSLSISNIGTEAVQYTTDGTNWTTVAAAGSATVGGVTQALFRLRKGVAGSYPVPVDVTLEAQGAGTLTAAQGTAVRALVSVAGNFTVNSRDGLGRVTSYTDAADTTYTVTYGNFGPATISGGGVTRTYTYSAAGLMTGYSAS